MAVIRQKHVQQCIGVRAIANKCSIGPAACSFEQQQRAKIPLMKQLHAVHARVLIKNEHSIKQYSFEHALHTGQV